MKYVTKTTHSSDRLEIRESRKQKLHLQNEDNLSTHSAFMCSGVIIAPKNLSTGKIPLSGARNLLCEIYKAAATPNYQFFLKCKEILNSLSCAVTSRKHSLNRLPKKMAPVENSLNRPRITSQCNYGLIFSNLTINLTRPVNSYFSLTTAKTVANGSQYPALTMFHHVFHQSLLLTSNREYIRPTGTPASSNPG